MALRVVTQLIDDLSGSEIPEGKGETVRFSLDGVTYEIDLSTKNAQKLRTALSGYTAAARRVARATGRARSAGGDGPSSAEIKAWARINGYEVADLGRVPIRIQQAYAAAHGR